jgi:hypothetical protein
VEEVLGGEGEGMSEEGDIFCGVANIALSCEPLIICPLNFANSSIF